MRRTRAWLSGGLLTLAALLLLLWWGRAAILAQAARAYFRAHNIQAVLSFSEIGFAGVSGRFALGPKSAPILAAQRIELRFDPGRWKPYVTEVRLIRPVVRVGVAANGKVTFGALQNWIASLAQGQGGSQFVSPDLAVSVSGLRLIAATPAGPMEWDGDARFFKNLPVSAHLRAKPTLLNWSGVTVALGSANLDYQGPQASFRITGRLRNGKLDVRALTAEADAAGLSWGQGELQAKSARFLASGRIAQAGLAAIGIRVGARDLVLGAKASRADIRVQANAGLEAKLAALDALDPPWARALEDNLRQVNLDFAAHLEMRGGNLDAQLTAPLTVEGAKGGVLRMPMARVSTSSEDADADFRMSLQGEGLPSLSTTVRHLVWQGGKLAAQTEFAARFDYGAFKQVGLGAQGALRWDGPRYAFEADHCAAVAVKAFRSGKDLVRDMSARLCPEGRPLFSGEGTHWRFAARADEAKALLPPATSALDRMAGNLSFEGEGGQFGGHVAIEKARLSDRGPSLRFNPLSGSGQVDYAHGVWRGKIAVAGAKGTALGSVEFTHAMAGGKGTARISAPHLSFATKGFQPQDISPLLAGLRDAQGPVSFSGDVTWTPQAIASRGLLDVQGLEFVTPLGRAHELKTRIALSSLLPPKTEGVIPLSISRIDWALPISRLQMRFSLTPEEVEVRALSLDWAQGQVAVEPFALRLGGAPSFSTTARLKDISLESLVAASNLGAKLKLSGKVSGTVPLAWTAQGVRISNGRIAASGPGRLSVDRSLWMQGDAAISSNAVQDFAYQALENLAYDGLSADLNTVAGGRLAVLFHIKGKSAPPKPQTANVSLLDILNGTALYKPIPLPSGTPIDLTLDTSLNFDELLKSYAQAWSEALRPNAAK